MAYQFYGWKKVTPRILDLYDRLSKIWSAETCAPRMRKQWTPENPTLGQCSITAFLVQDLLGGKVYGIPRPDGSFHCYNEVDGMVFDLTSEQFGDEVLSYENNPEQKREDHFATQDKRDRFFLLTQKFMVADSNLAYFVTKRDLKDKYSDTVVPAGTIIQDIMTTSSDSVCFELSDGMHIFAYATKDDFERRNDKSWFKQE